MQHKPTWQLDLYSWNCIFLWQSVSCTFRALSNISYLVAAVQLCYCVSNRCCTCRLHDVIVIQCFLLRCYLIVSLFLWFISPDSSTALPSHTWEINQKPTTIKCIRFISSTPSHIVVSQVIKHHYGTYNKDTVAVSTEDPL